MEACDTIFGWTLTGAGNSDPGQQPTTTTCLKLSVEETPDQVMQRLWALKEVPGEDSSLTADELTADELTADELTVVTHFQDTCARDAHG